MRGTTIAINGRLYDARTGLPVTSGAQQPDSPQATKAAHVPHRNGTVISDVGVRSAPTQPATTVKPVSSPSAGAARRPKAAHSIHKIQQRSKTLHRAALKRPAQKHQAQKPALKRSPAIQKFAPIEPATPQPAQAPPQPEKAAAQPALVAPSSPIKPAPLQGSALKEKLIADKMAEAMPTPHKHSRPAKQGRKFPRLATIASGIASLVLLGGYLTYLNLPSLSLRVAASQAGVAATYPSYQPSGYSFAGPVAYSPGEVRVNFKSNTNEFTYSVVQQQSNWDSQAVRDNYVLTENKQYTTIQEGGITIYLVNNKAVWVNGGVFYTVEGSAPLSGEQIQKIAASTL